VADERAIDEQKVAADRRRVDAVALAERADTIPTRARGRRRRLAATTGAELRQRISDSPAAGAGKVMRMTTARH